MYAPTAFAVSDRAEIAAMIQRAPLATVVVHTANGLEAAHLPMLYDAAEGVLLGHLARENPVAVARPKAGMAMFRGASAYVSPGYYPSKQEHGRVVPTWNYEAVQVYGSVEWVEDPAQLREIVAGLTEWFERDRAQPWALDHAPEAYVQGMLRAIVGVRIRIERVEAVRKLSQNRSRPDREGVRIGLAASSHAAEREVAALMGEVHHG